MTKKIIYQINIPNALEIKKPAAYKYISEMYEISERNARCYAERCQADYYKVCEIGDWKPGKNKHIDYQKLKMIDFEDYDQIVYFDSDYIIKQNAPNIFEMCGNNFSACVDSSPISHNLATELSMPIDRYFNAGFMYLTKEVVSKIKPFAVDYIDLQDWSYHGQGMLNKLMFDLGIQFNSLSPAEWNPVGQCFGKYADHYAGHLKRNWGTISY
jgi:lipopolysaccharide biosynthesis glycosyltransferase